MNRFMLRKPLALLLSVVMVLSSALAYAPVYAISVTDLGTHTRVEGEGVLQEMFDMSDVDHVLMEQAVEVDYPGYFWILTERGFGRYTWTEWRAYLIDFPEDDTIQARYMEVTNEGDFSSAASPYNVVLVGSKAQDYPKRAYGTVVILSNDPPEIFGSVDVDQGDSVIFDWLSHVSDDRAGDESKFSLELQGNPVASQGSVTDNGDGTFTYEHDGSEPPAPGESIYMTMTVFDGVHKTTGEIGINVTNNTAPTIPSNPININVVQGSLSNTVLLFSDISDTENNTISINDITNSEKGNPSLNAAGDVVYSHYGTDTDSDSFTFVVSDGTNDVPVMVNITVTPKAENAAPMIPTNPIDINVLQGSLSNPVLSLSSISDAENDTILILDITNSEKGNPSLNATGDVVYSHYGIDAMADVFTFNIFDGFNTVAVTVNVTVTPSDVNQKPIADDFTKTVNEGVTDYMINLSGYIHDDSGNAPTVVDAMNSSKGNAYVLDGKLYYTHTASPNVDTDKFTYVVKDKEGLQDTGVITIKFNDKSNKFILNDDAAIMMEDQSVTHNVIKNDIIENGLKDKWISKQGEHGYASFRGNSIRYTPNNDYVGFDSVEYKVKDEFDKIESAVFVIDVRGEASNLGYITDDWISDVDQGASKTKEIIGNDYYHADVVGVYIDEYPTKGTADLSLNLDEEKAYLVYTAFDNSTGLDTVVYRTELETGQIYYGTVTIDLDKVDKITIMDDVRSVWEQHDSDNHYYNYFPLLDNDIVTKGVKYTRLYGYGENNAGPYYGDAKKMGFDDYYYRPDIGFNGIDTFRYVVWDEDGYGDVASVIVHVVPRDSMDNQLKNYNEITYASDPIDIDVSDQMFPAEFDISSLEIVADFEEKNGSIGTLVVNGSKVTFDPNSDINDVKIRYDVKDDFGHHGFGYIDIMVRNTSYEPYLEIIDESQRVNQYYHPELEVTLVMINEAIELLWEGVPYSPTKNAVVDYKFTKIISDSAEHAYNDAYVDLRGNPISPIFFFGDFNLIYKMKDSSTNPMISDQKKNVYVNGRPILKYDTFDPYDFDLPYNHLDLSKSETMDTSDEEMIYFGEQIDFFNKLHGFDWEDYRTYGQLTLREYSEANSTPLIPDGMQLMYYLNGEMTGRDYEGIWADLTVGRLLNTDEFGVEEFDLPEGAYASGRIQDGDLEGVAYTDYMIEFTLIDSERNVMETPDGYESPRTETKMIRILNNEPELTGIAPFSAYKVTLPDEPLINPLYGVDVIDPEDEAYLGRPELLEGIVLTIENMSTNSFVSAEDMSTTQGKYLLAYTYVDIHGEMDIEHAEVWMVAEPELSIETPLMTMDLGGNFPTMVDLSANYWPNGELPTTFDMNIIDDQSVVIDYEITASVDGYDDVVPYFTPLETGTYKINYKATMTIQTSPLISGSVDEKTPVMPEPVVSIIVGEKSREVIVKNPEIDDLKNYMYISDFNPTDYMKVVNEDDIYQYDLVMKYKPNAAEGEEKIRLVTSVYHGNMRGELMDQRDTIDDLAVTSDGKLYSIDVDSVNLYMPMHGEFDSLVDLTLFTDLYNNEYGYDEITSVSLTVDADDNLVAVVSLLDTDTYTMPPYDMGGESISVDKYMHMMVVVDTTPEEGAEFVFNDTTYNFALIELKPIHTNYHMITDIAFDGAFEQLFALGYDDVSLVHATEEEKTDLPGPSGYELIKINKYVSEETSSPVSEAMMLEDGDYETEYVRILIGDYNFHGLATLGDSIFMTRYTGMNYVMRSQMVEDEVMWKTYLDEFNADGQLIGEAEMVEDMLRGATGAAAKFDNVFTLTPVTSTISYTENVTLTLTGLPKIAYDNIGWTASKGSISSPTEGDSGVYTAVYTPVIGTAGGTDTVTINVVTDGGNITATVYVTTPAAPDTTPDTTPARTVARTQTVIGVSLDTDAVTLDYGETADPAFTSYDFTETVTGTTNTNVTWSLSDDAFVSVDENGVVTTNDNIPVGTGDITVTLTVETENGGATATATILFEEQTPLGAIDFFEPYVSGYTDGTFRENSPVTRAEIANMFAKILKLNRTTFGTQKFTDVSKDHWAYGSIQAMYTTGLFSGYFDDDGLRYFDPEKPIGRGEIAQVFTNYWDFLDVSVTSANNTVIPDVAPNYWAASAINRIFNTGIFSGFDDGTFRPEEPTLRGQVVSMINKLIARPANEAGTGSFTDILSTSEYYGDIEAASQTFLKPQGE